MAYDRWPDVRYFPSPAGRGLPFSEAVSVDEVLYVSGQIGVDETGRLAPGGIAAETRQAMENIKDILARHLSSLDHVFKVTVMLADMADWAEMNRVYVTFFPNHLPARSAFGVRGLALGARVEIECQAVLR
jgi:reactive intermediate/imine deaminase